MTKQMLKNLIKSNRYLEQDQLRFVNSLKATIGTDTNKHYRLIIQNERATVINTNRLISDLMEQKLINSLQGFAEDIKHYMLKSIKIVSISHLNVFKYVTQLNVEIDVMDSETEIRNKITEMLNN